MVVYIRSDLEFILKQIKIAEDHALFEQSGGTQGKPLFGVNGSVPANNISWGLRTVDGSYNNLIPGQTQYGSADQPFPELLPPEFRPSDATFDPDGPGPAPNIATQTTYAPSDDPGSIVVDSQPRTISNLIVDQTITNPAAVARFVEAGLGVIGDGINGTAGVLYYFDDLAAGNVGLEVPRAVTLTIPNVSPDVGLSASFNSWFTLFGQFFDHGLDIVGKGGSGTVFVPLQPDDPLLTHGPNGIAGDGDEVPANMAFMVLTRATVGPGADNVMGTEDDTRPVNHTTPFVDQNQTYASHPSHQVFLRQYVLNGVGEPVATGQLITGPGGGMATWGDVKAQARDILGIDLTDYHVGNLPLLATDRYGNFIPDPDTGFPQVVMAGPPQTLASGTPGSPLVLVNVTPDGPDADSLPDVEHLAVRTGHAFLADIAHDAVPEGKIEDGDIEIGLANPENGAVEYDNELLDAHFIAGDGRVNENIGLTAVHHVFHAEHNRLVQHTMDVVLATGDLDFINEWLVEDLGVLPAGPEGLIWDGERLFQAAKFGTEMQYQHLVFEEFARKIQPNIDVFLVPQGYDVTIDPAIVAEFAHVVYRFGHSMLTETIDRFDPTFTADHIGLIEGFLNPAEFLNGGTAEQAAGSIIRGMTRQVGNEIDEFVTEALRNNLLGLPLDLPTINLVRGRDTGVPSLNAARRDFYEATNNNALLKPYESWVDFAGHLKNEASIINFIAAYGTHDLIENAVTLQEKRDAALTIITGTSVGGFGVPADAVDFLNGLGAYAGDLGGLEKVDLWIGGLAEEIMPFGGMLGSTFNFVFEVQMEKLQNSDRFYYLQRLDGLHLFGEMEANSFAKMIMANTDATHLPSDVFSTPGLILEVDQTRQRNDLNGDGLLETTDPVGGSILVPLVIRNNPATPGADTNYLRYTGDQHIVLGGTEANDILISSEGDDTLFGDGGNDRLEGGYGNDIMNAGDGDDIVTDLGGDDNIKGGDGNDAINAGQGANLVLGGAGQDFIIAGNDGASEVFGGTGNDFIMGSRTTERILGNEGDDWIEIGTFDGAPGDNFDEIFANDQVKGHDVFLGDGSTDEYIAEGGDDIMVGSAGVNKLEGMSGFDWATYKDNGPAGAYADLLIVAFDERPLPPSKSGIDAYTAVEALSGSQFDDQLFGSHVTSADLAPVDPLTGLGGSEGFAGSILDAEGIARIAGLQAVVGAGVTSFDAGNILLGGGGSDEITGRGGDDIIDGDKWLNVRISVRENADGTGDEIDSADSMSELVNEIFSGTYNPGQLQIVREILDGEVEGDVDVAVFSDLRANYTITNNANGTATVAHTGGTLTDGTDTLHNIERVRFSDMEIALNTPPTGAAVVNDLTPTEGQPLSVNTTSIEDANGLGAFSRQWQSSTNGVTWNNIAGATGTTFTPQDLAGITAGAHAGLQIRVAVSYTDGAGTLETVFSTPTAPVGLDWDGPNGGTTFTGNAGDDVADAGSGVDTMNGNAGNDDLDGNSGNDLITGGAGNDIVEGGANTDTAIYAGAVTNFSFEQSGTANISVIDSTGAEGTDTAISIETLRFNGVNYAVVAGSPGNNANMNGGVNGAAGSQAVFGFGGTDSMNGGTGNDILHGGDGTDTITQSGATGGRDSVNGGVGNDTYILTGDASAETYRIYTRAAATLAGMTITNTNTEIVVTRNGTTNAEIIAELDNIEEITVNSLNTTANNGNNPTLPDGGISAGDTVIVIGNFDAPNTSLNFNTITIDGNAGDDTIDISSLDSAHRIVFRSNGGNDTLIGNLRPQDVIKLPEGTTAASFTTTTNASGISTMTNGTHSITFAAPNGMPQVGYEDDEDEEDDDHNDNDDDDTAGDDDDNCGCDDDDDTGPVSGPILPASGVRMGTPMADVLTGTAGDDDIIGLAGDDYATGGAGADAISVGEGADFVNGGDGRDVIFAGAGDDQVFAGAQADVVYGDAGADRIFGDAGNDLINAGAGDDTVFGGAGNDLIVAEIGDGNDVYFGDDSDGGTGVDTLDMSAVTANVSVNLGSGPMSNGTASSSQTGNDTIWGIENVNTGAGNDTITASNAANVMNGGAGNDTYKFTSASAADGDTILGFEPGDRVDLTAIDANIGVATDQSFTLVSGPLTAAGQLAVTFESRADGDFTVIQGNIDGNADADFTIEIAGHHNLTNANLGL